MTTRHENKPRMTRQWTGDTISQTILASPAVAETVQLTQSVATEAALAGISEFTHKTTYLQFSVRRLLTSALGAVGFVVWKGKLILGTSTPAQAQAPQSASRFLHADEDIMLSGIIPVPPAIRAAADDTLIVSNEVLIHQVQVKAMRKFNAANHGIFLQMTASTASVVSVQLTWRTLLLR